MASEDAATRLQEELSCAICLECFRDPVSIHCGHNFCRGCITNYWRIRKEKTFSCPRCRETSRKKTLKPNLELKNIVEIAPKLQVAKEAGEMTCKRHREPLKLFCKDDQMLICVVCDKSKEHQNHAVLPLEEAAQDYQGGRTLHFGAASSIQQGAQIPPSRSQASSYGGRRPGSFRQRLRQCWLGQSPPSATTCPQLMLSVPPVLPGPAYHQSFAAAATTTTTTTEAFRMPSGPACQLPGEGRQEVSSRPAHQQSDEQKQIQDQLTYLRQDKEQLLAFKAIGATNHKESLRKITSEMQKAESIFEQAHEFLSEQKQFLLAQWESLKTAAEKQQQEHTNKLSEKISCLDSLITEAEGRCRRPTTDFLQDVKSTLVRLKKRKFQDSMETSSELEESLNSLIRKNVVVEEILQKIKDTLPSEVEKGQTKSPAALEAANDALSFDVAGSPAMKRKVVRHVVVPVRNMNAQRYQTAATSSASSSDGNLGRRMSFPAPSEPDKMASTGDATTIQHKEKSFPQCPLS